MTFRFEKGKPMSANTHSFEELYRQCLASKAPAENQRMMRNNHPGATGDHRDKARKVSDKSKASIADAMQRHGVATIADICRTTRLSASAVGETLYQMHKRGEIERSKVDRTYIYNIPGVAEKKRKTAPNGTPAIDQTLAVLRECPGLTNPEIAARIGVSETRARSLTLQLFATGQVTRQKPGGVGCYVYEVAQ